MSNNHVLVQNLEFSLVDQYGNVSEKSELLAVKASIQAEDPTESQVVPKLEGLENSIQSHL